MPIRVEIYAADGVAIGVIARAGRLREILECGDDLLVERVTWHPLDGTAARRIDARPFGGDDVLLALTDQPDDHPVHAQWHDIALDLGPYRVTGQLPTMPGFDPGRALARPTGEFVPLRDVVIALAADPDHGTVSQTSALVNRYVVDRVAADIMLGFFFPGAEMVVTGAVRSAPVVPPPPDRPPTQLPAPAAAPAGAPATSPSTPRPAAILGAAPAAVPDYERPAPARY